MLAIYQKQAIPISVPSRHKDRVIMSNVPQNTIDVQMCFFINRHINYVISKVWKLKVFIDHKLTHIECICVVRGGNILLVVVHIVGHVI